MVESLILFLIYVAITVGVAYLVIWVLAQLGIPLPPMVVKVFWIVICLVVILLLWRTVGPALTSGHLLR